MGADVTIAVVSWNTRDLLKRCLRSMEPEVTAGRAEVWVVDNGSTDGSPELAEEQFAWAELVRAERNLGFGPAVNRVASTTSAPWIAPANADIELAPGALERLLATGGSDISTGSVAPRLVLTEGGTQHSVHSFPAPLLGATVNLGLHHVVPGLGERLCLEGFWNPDRPRRVPWAHGAFLLVRRAAWDAAGGFDEDQWMYAEDIDLAWRLRRAGFHTAYEPRAHVRHAVSAATLKAFGPDRERRHLSAAYAWLERRRGRAAALAYGAFNIGGALARWILATPPALLGSETARSRRSLARHYVSVHRAGLAARAGGGEAG